jgi:NodT family efflux transporter outer membrane factor (OMF) lipoprotein
MRGLLSPLALAVCASSCAAGASHQAQTPPAAQSGFVEAAAPNFSTAAPQDAWWRLYDDPLLEGLIVKALAANTDLRSAQANLRRSRALLSEQRSARLPSTTLRAQTTDARARPDAAAAAADAEPNEYEAWADINFEVDLFGRLNNAVRAARADALAQQAAYDLVRITVAADVAHAYADVCTLGAQAAAAKRSLAIQGDTARIAGERLKVGEISAFEADQAQAELQRTRAALPLVEAERRIGLYRLATLLGQPPASYPKEVETCDAPPKLLSEIAVGDGAALLARRPDVRQAERRLAAATARIGVATADLYPRLSIGFSDGVTKEQGGEEVYRLQLTPLITWSFPNVFATRARIKQARAGADVALAEWDGAVLQALREVETALAQYAAEKERNQALTEMRARGIAAARSARLRRESGEDSPLVQLDSERRLVEAETLLSDSNRRLANSQITLFLSLGGGWQGAADRK